MLEPCEIMERVRALVEGSGMTAAEIARICGEPEQKIRRVLADGKSPAFVPLCGIITACGGSVDEIIGAAPAEKPVPASDALVIQLRADLRHERRQNSLGWVLFAAVAFIAIGVLIFDIANPQFGWVRYNIQQAAARMSETASYTPLGAVWRRVCEFIL